MIVEARFRQYVGEPGPDGCQEWLGTRAPQGYGLFRVGDSKYGAHRVAYALAHGETPTDRLVLHSCDNKGCVNFAHLHLGDHRLNSREAWDRGCHERTLAASRRPKLMRRALPPEREAELVRLQRDGASKRSLAHRFGIAEATVRRALARDGGQ